MMHGTVSSGFAFDPRSNPSRRLDATFLLILGAVEKGDFDGFRRHYPDLFHNRARLQEWLKRVHAAPTFEAAMQEVLLTFRYKRDTIPDRLREPLRRLTVGILEDLMRNNEAAIASLRTLLAEGRSQISTPAAHDQDIEACILDEAQRIALHRERCRQKQATTPGAPGTC